MHLFNSRQSWLVKKDVNLKKCWIDNRGGRERIRRLGKRCSENVPTDKLWDEVSFPLACCWSNGFFFLIHSPAVVLNVAGRGGAGGRGAPASSICSQSWCCRRDSPKRSSSCPKSNWDGFMKMTARWAEILSQTLRLETAHPGMYLGWDNSSLFLWVYHYLLKP